jgi:hypothetical protein
MLLSQVQSEFGFYLLLQLVERETRYVIMYA